MVVVVVKISILDFLQQSLQHKPSLKHMLNLTFVLSVLLTKSAV